MLVGTDVDDVDFDDPIESSAAGSINPFDFVYSNLPDSTHIMKKFLDCGHCKSKKFERETPIFCCRKGQIDLVQPEPIQKLMRLWSSADVDSRHFQERIRYFNGHFTFTTLGVNLDKNCTNMRSGVYTFRASGNLYHNVHSFGPGSRPEHL